VTVTAPPDPGPVEARGRTGPSPAVIATAVALPIALLVGVVVASVLAQRAPVTAPVVLASAPAPDSANPACATLLAALPDALGGAPRAALADPAPAGAAAWSSTEVSGEPLVLRCGIPRPETFTVDANLLGVNGVQFLEIPGAPQGIAATTYVAVDRAAYIALTLPDGQGSGAVQELADIISADLPANDLDPAPLAGS
jgi:hypothetical protein